MSNENGSKSNLNLFLLIIFTAFAILLTIPVFTKVPPHADEYQFYFNAFSIMGGKELQNYFHVALTEYSLAAFFLIVNLFTDSGVNFPQGDPSAVTYYYGRFFGFILYLATFILGILILQKNEKKIKLRSVIFSVLYFSSIGVFERFFRVNSDSMIVFVFLNYIILSFYLHKNKSSILKFFILNVLFIFLGTFTNLKFLYLSLPLILLNIFLPFFIYSYENKGQSDLPKIYRFLLYLGGLAISVVVLWVIFMPKPFNTIVYWYSIKHTITYGTKFDFDYPGQSFGSWKMYLYDLFSEYIGFNVLFVFIFLFYISYKCVGRQVFTSILGLFKKQLKFFNFKEGNLHASTEVILAFCFITYYLGVSAAVVHWSRWGIPLGMLGIMLLSSIGEKIFEIIFSKKDKIKFGITGVIFVSLSLSYLLRVFLTIDLYRTNYPKKDGFTFTYENVDKFLQDHEHTPDANKKATWFTGYTSNIKSMSLENIIDPINSDIKYIFWPYWNIGLLYTSNNVDLETHNQRQIVDKYAKRIYFQFPSLISYYTHYASYVAWKFFNITYIPEIEGMVEPQYAVVELKETPKDLNLSYDITFKDMSHYTATDSKIFNLKNLKDSYMFPPCYTYPDTISAKTGESILPPPDIGIGARTAGLYCHSTRFRLLFKGDYRIKVIGLPDDPNGEQRVFSNMGGYKWDPISHTLTFRNPTTFIPGDFGVATKEKNLPNLKFRIFYKLD